ncbi:hypothetical protein GVAV_001167 [Gurleya vavrai]
MKLEIITTDNKIFQLNEHQIKYSSLLTNLSKFTTQIEPVNVLISEKTLQHVLYLMDQEQILLQEDYEFSQIRINEEHKKYFRSLKTNILIEICNAANYLDYKYLLETISFILAERLKGKDFNEIKKNFW